MPLTIELIPQTSFFKNLRSELPVKQWDSLRKSVYQKAGYQCEICGGRGGRHPVECHEIWEYQAPIQKLVGLIALCPSCHMVKHWGLTQLRGKENIAKNHLARVNGWTQIQIQQHIDKSFLEWHNRNSVQWELNLDMLKEFI